MVVCIISCRVESHHDIYVWHRHQTNLTAAVRHVRDVKEEHVVYTWSQLRISSTNVAGQLVIE